MSSRGEGDEAGEVLVADDEEEEEVDVDVDEALLQQEEALVVMLEQNGTW